MSEGETRNASRPRARDPILAAASGMSPGTPAPTSVKADGRKVPGRSVSLSELADLTGYDRDTIASWIDRKGLPIEQGGSAGVAYSISVRRFIEWKEAQAREEERAKAPSAGTFEGWMGLTDPGKAADAQFKIMRAAEKAGELVPRAYVQDVFAQVMNIIWVAVMSIPDRMYREKAGMPEAERRAGLNKGRDHAANALKVTQAELDRSLDALDAAASAPCTVLDIAETRKIGAKANRIPEDARPWVRGARKSELMPQGYSHSVRGFSPIGLGRRIP